MAIEVTTRVWKHSKAKGSDLLLRLALADRSNEYGVCWPGIGHLADKTRTGPRQVKRMIQNAERDGELYVERGKGRKNTSNYFLTVGLSQEEIEKVLIHQFRKTPMEALMIANQILQKHDTDDTFIEEGKGDIQGRKGDISGEKVTSRAKKGDSAMSPDSSVHTSVYDSSGGDGKDPTPPTEIPALIDAIQAERIFTQVTGMITFPSRGRDLAIDAICKIYTVHREKTIDYLQPFWQAQKTRRRQDGAFISRTSYAWLDWAIAGEVPEPYKPPKGNNGNDKDPFAGIREFLEEDEVKVDGI